MKCIYLVLSKALGECVNCLTLWPSCGDTICYSNFCICEQNPIVSLFKWNLLDKIILQKRILKFLKFLLNFGGEGIQNYTFKAYQLWTRCFQIQTDHNYRQPFHFHGYVYELSLTLLHGIILLNASVIFLNQVAFVSRLKRAIFTKKVLNLR